MPGILYGTAWKKSDTARLVKLAIQKGFRGIDTACQPKHYDEAGVGAALAASLQAGLTRSEIYLQTKFTSVSGQDPARVPYDPNAPLQQQVAQSFAASLRNLQTNYLDGLLLHSPMPMAKQTEVVWQEFESLVDAGTVRQIGISNCYSLAQIEQLHRDSRIKPAVVQNRFYAETGYDREIRAFCREKQIAYQSFWTLSANPDVLAHPTLSALSRTHQRTAPQILFRYLSQAGVVPLTGTRSEIHMSQDLAIFEFELNGNERRAVDAILMESTGGTRPRVD
jgi:diketogulonate reductase-like aldo/keto reductase